ncbi:MAG: hypothetical protein II849_08835, partial [Bacteroidales bacterium]|nr:hypothetical protein [Bacteroidales bacterium]
GMPRLYERGRLPWETQRAASLQTKTFGRQTVSLLSVLSLKRKRDAIKTIFLRWGVHKKKINNKKNKQHEP